MSDRRRGLGRGLGALIPAGPAAGEAERTTVAGGAPAAGPATGTASAPTGSTAPAAASGAASAERVTTMPAPTGPAVSAVDHVIRSAGRHLVDATASGSDGAASVPHLADPAPTPAPVAGAYFAEIPLDAITPNPRQPREVFDEEALAELVQSIREVGLLQPIVVRQLSPERYELVMGERRWRASRDAGLTAIPAIVRATEDDKLLLDALLENLHRSQLNPLEEAAAYDQLLGDFSCTHEELADRIGRSRSQVTNTLRLLRLPPAVQRRVAAGVLSAGHARALLALDGADEQDRLAQRIVAEGLSVRAVEEIVALGGQSGKPVRKPRAGRRLAPALTDLAHRLSDRFETRVRVDLGQKKGKIVVEFASIEDLERIVEAMSPGTGEVFPKTPQG